MRRVWAVAILAAPALAWLPMHVWAQAYVDDWAAGRTPTLAVRLALFLENWAIRMLPFLVFAAIPLGALIAIGLARLGGSGDTTDVAHERRQMIAWWLSMIGVGLLFLVVWGAVWPLHAFVAAMSPPSAAMA